MCVVYCVSVKMMVVLVVVLVMTVVVVVEPLRFPPSGIKPHLLVPRRVLGGSSCSLFTQKVSFLGS